jgi:hypothetical protein
MSPRPTSGSPMSGKPFGTSPTTAMPSSSRSNAAPSAVAPDDGQECRGDHRRYAFQHEHEDEETAAESERRPVRLAELPGDLRDLREEVVRLDVDPRYRAGSPAASGATAAAVNAASGPSGPTTSWREEPRSA